MKPETCLLSRLWGGAHGGGVCGEGSYLLRKNRETGIEELHIRLLMENKKIQNFMRTERERHRECEASSHQTMSRSKKQLIPNVMEEG